MRTTHDHHPWIARFGLRRMTVSGLGVFIIGVVTVCLLQCSGCAESESVSIAQGQFESGQFETPDPSETQYPSETQRRSGITADEAPASATTETDGLVEFDPLANILALSSEGQAEQAIRQFLESAEIDWVATTSIPTFELSESDFEQLSRIAQANTKGQLIQQVMQIKGFARKVIARANELNAAGDTTLADQHIDAVRRLGEQMRDADILRVLQRTGEALAGASLEPLVVDQ